MQIAYDFLCGLNKLDFCDSHIDKGSVSHLPNQRSRDFETHDPNVVHRLCPILVMAIRELCGNTEIKKISTISMGFCISFNL